MSKFVLDIDGRPPCGTLDLRLYQEPGRQFQTYRDIKVDSIKDQLGDLFSPAQAAQNLGRIWGDLRNAVLGKDIADRVSAGGSLVVETPPVDAAALAAALTQVPWELALSRAAVADLMAHLQPTRIAPRFSANPKAISTWEAQSVGGDGPVKVLLVFPDAAQRPLAAALERECILESLYNIMRTRNIEVDTLCLGVTRERLELQIRKRNGYHIVHWSGHGHRDSLEIEGGRLDGATLAECLSVGELRPSLCFLSACHSAAPKDVVNWDALWQTLRDGQISPTAQAWNEFWTAFEKGGKAPAVSPSMEYSNCGTALKLVRSGIPQVIAMRHAVGDRYARELAAAFYQFVFGDDAHTVESALSAARSQLGQKALLADSLAPVVIGPRPLKITPKPGRSLSYKMRHPNPPNILPNQSRDLNRVVDFAGRQRELLRLKTEWLEQADAVMAVVVGLPGIGKTALAAEAIHLWHSHFDYVLGFSARNAELSTAEFFKDLHERLDHHVRDYRERCRDNPDLSISVGANPAQMAGKLADELCRTKVLLVLNDFDSNLLSTPRPDGTHEPKDLGWNEVLAGLCRGTRGGSRVLVTTRLRPTRYTVPEGSYFELDLPPLSWAESLLILSNKETLIDLATSSTAEDVQTMIRLLQVVRGHPLLLRILTKLNAAGRGEIERVLTQIAANGYAGLPALVPSGQAGHNQEETRYLREALTGAVDVLLNGLSAEELLAMEFLENEPSKAVELRLFRARFQGATDGLLDSLARRALISRHQYGEIAIHPVVRERLRARAKRG